MRTLRDSLTMPRSKVGKAALFLVPLAIFLRTLSIAKAPPLQSASLWIAQTLIQSAAILVLAILVLRWVKQTLMWRLRNRLIITYLFIGLAPVVLLILLAGIAAYILAGQFAADVATSAINSTTATVAEQDRLLAMQLTHALSRGEDIASIESSNGENKILTAAYWNGHALLYRSSASAQMDETPPAWLRGSFRGLVVDHGQIAVRATEISTVKGSSLRVVSNL